MGSPVMGLSFGVVAVLSYYKSVISLLFHSWISPWKYQFLYLTLESSAIGPLVSRVCLSLDHHFYGGSSIVLSQCMYNQYCWIESCGNNVELMNKFLDMFPALQFQSTSVFSQLIPKSKINIYPPSPGAGNLWIAGLGNNIRGSS